MYKKKKTNLLIFKQIIRKYDQKKKKNNIGIYKYNHAV